MRPIPASVKQWHIWFRSCHCLTDAYVDAATPTTLTGRPLSSAEDGERG